MRFASLGSGSRGNALVVEAGSTRILLDCGIRARRDSLPSRPPRPHPEDLSAVVVTHEHDDHIGGVARLARRHSIPVWLTHGTLTGFESSFAGIAIYM